jgi:hypothetical protein
MLKGVKPDSFFAKCGVEFDKFDSLHISGGSHHFICFFVL